METEPQPTTPSNGPWYSSLPADLQSDPTIKSTPDVATLAKRFVDTNKEYATRVKIPALTDPPDKIAEFRAKVYQSGHFKAPPDSPEKYTINLPDTIPEQARSPEIQTAFRQWAHKHGLSDEAMQEGFGIYMKSFDSTVEAMKVDHTKAMESLNAFGAEMKRDPAELMGLADRMMTNLFKDDPEAQKYFENPAANGILKHPSMMKLLAHAALLTGADSGVIGNEMPQEVDFEEAKRIRTDASHPMFAAYHHENDRNHDKAVEIVNRAYQKQIPG